MYFVSIVASSTEPSLSASVFARRPTKSGIRLAAVVSALSQALDLSTGQPLGHSIRTCLLGMRIAAEIGVSSSQSSDLFYALLLKDCGCSGNASKTYHTFNSDDLKTKRDVKTVDWTRTNWETIAYAISHVAPDKPFLERSRALFQLLIKSKAHAKEVTTIRCMRGAMLANFMGLSEATAAGIQNLDEHWDGRGSPDGFLRTEVPLLSRIMLLAQTLEVFLAASGERSAVEVANKRSKKWFDPDLVRAVNSLAARERLWDGVRSEQTAELCLHLEPEQKKLQVGDSTLDRVCMAFSQIVDAKSPFTFKHSLGVANAAVDTARMLGLPKDRIVFVRHAALLHDLGKLGVSNSILEKPGKLDDDEWKSMRSHPFYTWKILSGIPGFEEMSEVAGSHHEKLDGSGYFRGLTAEHLPIEARVLAVADVFDALSAKRPYRDGLPREVVFKILREDAPAKLDASCVEALSQAGTESDQTLISLQNLNDHLNGVATSHRPNL